MSNTVMEIRLFQENGSLSISPVDLIIYCFFEDPLKKCLYFFEYSSDVLKKKKKVLDILKTDKKCFIKINIESSPPEIWIRIRFLEINGSPSLKY